MTNQLIEDFKGNRQKLQGAYDLSANILRLDPNDVETRRTLDVQLADYLEELMRFAFVNRIKLPQFPITQIRNSDYVLGGVMAGIDIAEIEVRKYIQSDTNF